MIKNEIEKLARQFNRKSRALSEHCRRFPTAKAQQRQMRRELHKISDRIADLQES